MIHSAPSMIAKGSCSLIHDYEGWAELADSNALFFQKIEFKVLCHFAYQG